MIFNNIGLWGVDLSKYQSDPIKKLLMDYQKLKEQGASFVIPKIGQYNYYDYDAEYNWKASKAAGFPRGAYWFLDYRDTGKRQAEKYMTFFDKHGLGEGIHFVDYEAGSGGEWQKVYDFIVRFQELSGLPDNKIGVYSAHYYWSENSPITPAKREWFSKYRYWHAWYIDNAPKTSVSDVVKFYTENVGNVKIPIEWTKNGNPIFWQAGTPAIGKMLGAQSYEIDFNLFNGDITLFNECFGTSITVPPVEEPPSEGGTSQMHNLIVLAQYLNGRATPSASGELNFPAGASYSSGFRKDDVLEAETKETVLGIDWYKITKCTRNGATVQLPVNVWASAGATYSLMRLYTPIPPVEEETPAQELWMSTTRDGTRFKYILSQE